MTEKNFFEMLPNLNKGSTVMINIKKNIKTFFEKEKNAILKYSDWDYDDDNPTILNLYFEEGFIFDLSQIEDIKILDN